jgi:hypothetical protein
LKNLTNANNNFWKVWKSTLCNNNNTHHFSVKNLTNAKHEAEYFAENIKNICSPNDFFLDSNFKSLYYAHKSNNVQNMHECIVTTEDVCKAISMISENKATGLDNVSISHVKNAHPVLPVLLAKLFNVFIKAGFVPDDFGKGAVSLIPKFKGNKNHVVADDFRGITISSVVSKIFEHCLLKYITCIKTSDRQFGFKKGVGCRNSIHALHNVLTYFNKRQCTVNIGSIDLKRAFDKVNIYGLLLTLCNRGVHSDVVNILENWLSKVRRLSAGKM